MPDPVVSANPRFYVVGGTMSPTSPSYIARDADHALLSHLLSGDFCYVLTARQMGKSSLMASTAQRLRAQGVRVAIVDLTQIGTGIPADEWYHAIAYIIATEFDWGAHLDSFWSRGSNLPALQRLTEFFRELVCNMGQQRSVIFFDEIDTTLALPFRDDFFAALRFCYNARATRSEFERLTFALLGVANPAQLMKDKRRTPFNVGQEVRLTDFTSAEARPLAHALGLPLDQSRQTLERILYWTSGHPYLTQKLCAAFAAAKKTTDGPAEVDRLVKGLFFSPGALRSEPNLKFVADSLTEDPRTEPLLSLFRSIRLGGDVRDDPVSPLHAALKLSGVVSASPEGRLAVRNRIYERLFTADWARGTEPPPEHSRVFISYSHDSPAHESKVLELSDRLRGDGIDAILDQYETFPPAGWSRWTTQQVKDARFVLVVCTENYQRRASGMAMDEGLGATFETNLIQQLLYSADAVNEKFIPVVLNSDDVKHIPNFLLRYSYFPVNTEEGYEDLCRVLTNQPRTKASALGLRRTLPALESKPDFANLVWNVPPRNPFFTGREAQLQAIRETFTHDPSGAPMHPQAISGMGGIGKTQTAIEYAHRYRTSYAAVLWSAADSHDSLLSGFAAFARLLNLGEKDEEDLGVVAAAVRRWLESNSGWLLILDDVEDPALLREFMPRGAGGHILITTRGRHQGYVAETVELEKLEQEQGALFLLRRAKLIRKDHPMAAASERTRALARQISQEVGGHPLALDQVGAFIEETPSTLEEYLVLYRAGSSALRARRGEMAGAVPSVSITISLAFGRLAEANQPAADIVRVCAFLAPEHIPEEIFVGGGSELGESLSSLVEEPLAWVEAIGETERFALIRRDVENKSFQIHRLVQEVVKDEMDVPTRRLWAERVVLALNRVFPSPEFQNWAQCERLIPHSKAAAHLFEEFELGSIAAARLLNRSGHYLNIRAQYSEAEPFYRRALATTEKVLGADHPDTSASLNNLAVLYANQGRYAEAEPLYKRALAIRERALGSDHPDAALSLNNLAALYKNQGRYEKAEPLYQRALAILEKALGPDHPSTGSSLNNLAVLYSNQGRYAQAEPLYQRALAIREKTLGPNHPSTGSSLNNLAALYHNQGRYAEAEPLYRRALEIREVALGPDHPDAAVSLNNLAALYKDQGRYAEAGPLLQRALIIREKTLGPKHPDTASSLNNLALLYDVQGRYAEAEPLYQRALSLREEMLGPEHPDTVVSVRNLATFLRQLGREAEANQVEGRVKARGRT